MPCEKGGTLWRLAKHTCDDGGLGKIVANLPEKKTVAKNNCILLIAGSRIYLRKFKIDSGSRSKVEPDKS